MDSAHVSERQHRRRWAVNSGMVREDQCGEGSGNHKVVDVIGERNLRGMLNCHLVRGRDRQSESRMVWAYLLGLTAWMSLEDSSFQFNPVSRSSQYLLFIDVSSLPLENICAYNPWLVKSLYFVDEILSLESGTSGLMKHVLLVVILRKHLLILVHKLSIISLPSGYLTAQCALKKKEKKKTPLFFPLDYLYLPPPIKEQTFLLQVIDKRPMSRKYEADFNLPIIINTINFSCPKKEERFWNNTHSVIGSVQAKVRDTEEGIPILEGSLTLRSLNCLPS